MIFIILVSFINLFGWRIYEKNLNYLFFYMNQLFKNLLTLKKPYMVFQYISKSKFYRKTIEKNHGFYFKISL